MEDTLDDTMDDAMETPLVDRCQSNNGSGFGLATNASCQCVVLASRVRRPACGVVRRRGRAWRRDPSS